MASAKCWASSVPRYWNQQLFIQRHFSECAIDVLFFNTLYNTGWASHEVLNCLDSFGENQETWKFINLWNALGFSAIYTYFFDFLIFKSLSLFTGILYSLHWVTLYIYYSRWIHIQHPVYDEGVRCAEKRIGIGKPHVNWDWWFSLLSTTIGDELENRTVLPVADGMYEYVFPIYLLNFNHSLFQCSRPSLIVFSYYPMCSAIYDHSLPIQVPGLAHREAMNRPLSNSRLYSVHVNRHQCYTPIHANYIILHIWEFPVQPAMPKYVTGHYNSYVSSFISIPSLLAVDLLPMHTCHW